MAAWKQALAPAAPTKQPAYLKVTYPGGTVCGTLTSADRSTPAPVTLPLITITNLAP